MRKNDCVTALCALGVDQLEASIQVLGLQVRNVEWENLRSRVRVARFDGYYLCARGDSVWCKVPRQTPLPFNPVRDALMWFRHRNDTGWSRTHNDWNVTVSRSKVLQDPDGHIVNSVENVPCWISTNPSECTTRIYMIRDKFYEIKSSEVFPIVVHSENRLKSPCGAKFENGTCIFYRDFRVFEYGDPVLQVGKHVISILRTNRTVHVTTLDRLPLWKWPSNAVNEITDLYPLKVGGSSFCMVPCVNSINENRHPVAIGVVKDKNCHVVLLDYLLDRSIFTTSYSVTGASCASELIALLTGSPCLKLGNVLVVGRGQHVCKKSSFKVSCKRLGPIVSCEMFANYDADDRSVMKPFPCIKFEKNVYEFIALYDDEVSVVRQRLQDPEYSWFSLYDPSSEEQIYVNPATGKFLTPQGDCKDFTKHVRAGVPVQYCLFLGQYAIILRRYACTAWEYISLRSNCIELSIWLQTGFLNEEGKSINPKFVDLLQGSKFTVLGNEAAINNW